jgi:outer membrane protein OmpA-like peptidoglycan-associated protein
MTRSAVRALALGPALFFLSGCCWTHLSRGPETLVVVVPSRHDGHVGAVVVHRGTEREVLDTAYAAARLGARGTVRRSELKPKEVEKIFAVASQALPPRATSYTLYFALATLDLTPESRETLKALMADLAGRPAAQIAVIGHTDRMGTPENNEALSLRRAKRMRERLIREGVPASIVHAFGVGEREPIVDTDDGVAEARNRRVEIIIR